MFGQVCRLIPISLWVICTSNLEVTTLQWRYRVPSRSRQISKWYRISFNQLARLISKWIVDHLSWLDSSHLVCILFGLHHTGQLVVFGAWGRHASLLLKRATKIVRTWHTAVWTPAIGIIVAKTPSLWGYWAIASRILLLRIAMIEQHLLRVECFLFIAVSLICKQVIFIIGHRRY